MQRQLTPEQETALRGPTAKLKSKGEVILERQQEILFDISMEVGIKFQQLSVGLRENLMDSMNGSRGLFDYVRGWVTEFDTIWEAKPEDDREDYIFHVTEFAHTKFEEIVARARDMAGRHAWAEMRRPYRTRLEEHLRKLKACHPFGYQFSPEEAHWLTGVSSRLQRAEDLDQMNKIVHEVALLVSKVIYELHQQGVTYIKLSSALDLSAGRTQQLTSRYVRILRMGQEASLPWAKQTEGVGNGKD